MELPNPPWYRRWSVILAGVIGAAAVVAMIGLLGLRAVDDGDPEPTAANLPTTTVTSTTTATTATTRQQDSTTIPSNVLWDETGRDNDKSPGFRAPASWHIEWSFDCSNFKSHGAGNFKITGDGAFEDIQIQEVDIEASGSRTYRLAGYGHLLVESVCDRWTVTAVAD
jgi:hypothetical protein